MPNPEEVFGPIDYQIYVHDLHVNTTDQKEFVHPNGSAQLEYRIASVDRTTGLSSPKSEAAVKLEGIILVRSPEPIITGEIGAFSSLTPTSARIVGSNEKLDLGSTVTANWPQPPPLLTSSDNFDFTVIARLFGWPKGGDTYTISAYPRVTYSNGSVDAGDGGYVLVTDGHRVQVTGRNQFFGTNTASGGVLKTFEVELSKDLFFNFGEALIRWDYTPLQ